MGIRSVGDLTGVIVEDNYEYDVSISFLAKDEPLASQIREALAPLSVFVYSKRQEAVAGSEGVESFRQIFRTGSRIALVLFRAGWGSTPWTRVEETAIRDYCLAEGWDRLLFVRLEREGSVPKWVPDSYIYLDLTTFGVSDLVGAIKFKLAKLGVQLRPLSSAEKAQKIAEEEKFNNETLAILRTSPQPFYDVAESLFALTEESLKRVREKTDWEISSGSNKRGLFVASVAGVSLTISPQELYANTAADAYLLFQTFQGKILTPQEVGKFYVWDEPKRLLSTKLELVRVPGVDWCWKCDGKLLSPVQTAEFIVNELISARDQVKSLNQ